MNEKETKWQTRESCETVIKIIRDFLPRANFVLNFLKKTFPRSYFEISGLTEYVNLTWNWFDKKWNLDRLGPDPTYKRI